MARIGVLIGLLALPGCSSLLSEGSADVAGIAGAGVASSVTRSAAAAAAIGLGVQSLAAEGVRYTARRIHRTEQNAIAGAAGPLDPGTVAPWQVRHSLPLEPNAAGQVVVSRAFGAGAFNCKEIVFSVDHATRTGAERSFYTATVCRDGETWRWASAEPAVARWGGLQ